MGRYYEGDINGKFMFGVQASNAADRFGVEGIEPNYLTYTFYEENLPKVEEELKDIEETIGLNNLVKLTNFFNTCKFYDEKELSKEGLLNIWSKYKSDYADYQLGIQIRDCIKQQGFCVFKAEL